MHDVTFGFSIMLKIRNLYTFCCVVLRETSDTSTAGRFLDIKFLKETVVAVSNTYTPTHIQPYATGRITQDRLCDFVCATVNY